jgi:GNAT superfamily N-acetyltransferase
MPPMAAVTIRRARPPDAERLTAIAHAAKRHWGYAESQVALWERDLTVTPAIIDEDLVFCAEAAGSSAIVGFHGLSRDTDVFELEHLWVDPPAMGHGHGAALFRHAIDVARAHGARELRIASDPNAEGFYLRMGAELVGAVPSTPEGRTLPLLVVRLLSDAAET